MFKLLRSWDGVVFSPPERGSQVCFPLRICAQLCEHIYSAVSSQVCLLLLVTALLLANLHEQVHCLQNFFQLSLSGGDILF